MTVTVTTLNRSQLAQFLPLSDVFPTFAKLNGAYGDMAHAVVASNSDKRSGVGTNCQNIIFGQFGMFMRRALGLFIAPFRHHIGVVFGIRSPSQMLRVLAFSIVATMQRVVVIWTRYARVNERQLVGKNFGSSAADSAISVRVEPCQPRPALICAAHVNFFRVAFKKRTAWAASPSLVFCGNFSNIIRHRRNSSASVGASVRKHATPKHYSARAA